MQTALVSGGSAGIGYSITSVLLQEGWAVTICGRDREKLSAVAAEADDHLHTVAANLAEPEDCDRLVTAHLDRFDTLDLLVNNAGLGQLGPIADKTDKALDLEISLNFRAAFRLLRACVPSLKASAQVHGRSTIINVSSLVARQTPPNASVYAATKSALTALSHSAHAELSRHGVHVTALLPGFVDTPGTSWVPGASRGVMIPPEDVGEAVRFLLRTSSQCFVPELMMTTAGPGVLHSPIEWETREPS